jgi:hypothetical protein
MVKDFDPGVLFPVCRSVEKLPKESIKIADFLAEHRKRQEQVKLANMRANVSPVRSPNNVRKLT